MLVMKFGGTSVGSAERLNGVLELISSAGHGNIVVLSAMSGITNTLIESAQRAVAHDLTGALDKYASIKESHKQAVYKLISDQAHADKLWLALENDLNELKILLQGISYIGELTPRTLDAVSSFGELFSSKILATAGQVKGLDLIWLDARQFVITDNVFGRANPSWEKLIPKSEATVLPLLANKKTIVTQGFIGATADGVTTTLGRGGSDFTASILGVALGAEEIQIWTDVDGMMTADPRVVPDAQVLSEVSFQEASELAYFGAKVLHPLTVKPAVEKNIPVRILNTLEPHKKGTLIKADSKETGLICAIAAKKGITAIFVSSPRMLMAHGFLAKVFQVFDKYETAIDLIATSEVSLALTIDRNDRLAAIKNELAEYGEVKVEPEMAIVTVVGRHFKDNNGIPAQIFNALKDISITMISGGASEINMSFVVPSKAADEAVRQLHRAFFKASLAV
jgi:aspartate kinase